MQRTFFDGDIPFKVKKPLRLIEFFAGYGSQSLSLKYLGVDFKHYKICEWAVKSIQAYKDIHFPNDNTDYSKEYSLDYLIDYLTKKGISANYNDPMTEQQVIRLGEKRLRTVYNNIIATSNLVNIMQVKGSDLEIVDKDNYDYLITYSFPCQDLSKAGKQKGMEKDSGTRSGMLWEVERILDELNQEEKLPQLLLMENVPDVIGSNNVKHFADWLKKLEELGYKNYWQTINAKEYGIPQNRERVFMVSILGNYDYTFPRKYDVKVKLKDVLEKKVDKKYYLSDKAIDYVLDMKDIQKGTKWEGFTENAKLNKEIAMTIGCRSASSQRAGLTNFIVENIDDEDIPVKEIKENLRKVRRAANKLVESGNLNDGEFYDVSFASARMKELEKNQKPKMMQKDTNIAPTLTTYPQNFGMVVKENEINRVGYYTKSQHSASVVVDENGIAPTVMGNHCTVTGVAQENKNLKEQLCDQLIESNILNDGDIINHSYTNKNKKQNSRLAMKDYIERTDGLSPTLTTRPDVLGYYENFSIRKLTPNECFRLMAVSDEDFENVKKNQSDASLYHLAGDSICVNVLMAIFSKLYDIDYVPLWQKIYNESIKTKD